MERHYKWSLGDALLISKNLKYTYWSFPNMWEIMLVVLVCSFNIKTIFAILLGEFIASFIFIFYKRKYDYFDQLKLINDHIILSIICSVLIKNSSKFGQIVSHITNKNFHCICRRFEWFMGELGDQEKENRIRDGLHFVIILSCIFLFN